MPGTTIARGNTFAEKIFTTTITPAQVAQNATAEQTFTVLGMQVGDYLNIQSVAAQTSGIIVGNVRVTALNTVSIQFANVTGSAATPVAGMYGCIMGRPESLPLDTNAL